MARLIGFIVALTFVFCASAAAASPQTDKDPIFDHQTKTYVSSHVPVNVSNASLTLEAFFSPDNSIGMYVDLIENAPANSKLDIYSPSFGSWSGCTWKDPEGLCIGCTAEQVRDEPFPVFPALLNAVHERNISVRIILNSYDDVTCPGKIAPLDYWSLNGVEVRLFQATTFMHGKVVIVRPPGGTADASARLAISSVNWSYSAFMKNREAGVLVHGSKDAVPLFSMVQRVFDADWGAGSQPYNVTNEYSAKELAFIRNTSTLPVVVPEPHIPAHFVPPPPTPLPASGVWMEVYASPDFARPQLLDDIRRVQHSLQLYMYQVTDAGLCEELIGLIEDGKNVTVLMSKDIYDPPHAARSRACYQAIYDRTGYVVQLTEASFKFAHQKYWIIDGKLVSLSTGNWTPADYPAPYDPSQSYPPYGEPNWQKVYRDFTVRIAKDPSVVAAFQAVFDGDFVRGQPWTPGSNETARMRF